MKRLMFVCLGNICRSPLARAVMEHIVSENRSKERYLIDSSGTGAWHIGETADPRIHRVGEKHGIRITHSAKQFRSENLHDFDLIFAMDESNRNSIASMSSEKYLLKKLHLFRSFDPMSKGNLDVPDPYYGGMEGFEEIFRIIDRTCRELFRRIEAERL